MPSNILVDGFVRDRLMEKECNDIDISVIGDAVGANLPQNILRQN
jgi:tRNA nucleotidyltransferase/poly(A) polymerase